MFLRHLSIDTVRIVSLNRLRKFRQLFDRTARCRESLRFDAIPTVTFSEQIRSIRRRAAGAPQPRSTDSQLRMEKIAGIRAAIAEGRYHVSADDLAQKMIDTVLDKRPPKP